MVVVPRFDENVRRLELAVDLEEGVPPRRAERREKETGGGVEGKVESSSGESWSSALERVALNSVGNSLVDLLRLS